MTTSSIERRKEAICPPWCAGHDDRYQAWQDRTDGGQLRNHGDHGHHVAGDVWVGVVAEENERHTLSEAIVELLVDAVGGGANIDLTPGQAREVAVLLVNAADTIENGERMQVQA